MKNMKQMVKCGYMPVMAEGNGFSFRRYHPSAYAKRDSLREAFQELQSEKNNLALLFRKSLPASAMAADIETTGLNPEIHELRLIGVAGSDFIEAYDSPEPVREMLSNPAIRKVFHNASFDVHFLQHKGFPVNNYDCTMVMSQVLDNNEGNHKLEALVESRFGEKLDKSHQKPECWDGFLFDTHYEYCKKDTEVALALYHTLSAELEEKGLQQVYGREARALPAIIRLQKDGMAFDSGSWRKELAGYKERRDSLEQEIKAELCSDIKISSPAQLLTCLRNRGLDIPNTNDETLALHEAEFPTLAKLRQWRELQKLCTGYGKKLIEKVRRGRIHASWRLIGATTGRMSCTGPNLQQVPHCLRKYFKAPAGRKLIIADYSQIELRIVAEMAQERVMLKAFQAGEDLHNITARMILKKERVSKDERQIAKACNFGLIYGMTAQGLRARARTAYGVDITEDEASSFRDGFFRLYPAIKRWHNKQINAREIKTLGGRVWRDIPDKQYRNRFNYPVQGTGAEGLKEALGLLVPGLPDDWKLCAVVHDEIVLEVPQMDADQARAYLVACMKGSTEQLLKVVPVEVDCKISDSWEK